MKRRILSILLCLAMLMSVLCLAACDNDKGRDRGDDDDDDVSAYSDPEEMTKDLLKAMFTGDGEDMWEAGNLDSLLDLAVKYGDVDRSEKAEQKQEMIDYYDEFCEELQDEIEDEFGKKPDFKFVVESTDYSKSDIKSLQEMIDPDGEGLKIRGAVLCEFEIYIDGDLFDDLFGDTGSVNFIKVGGEWMMFGEVTEFEQGGESVAVSGDYDDPEQMATNLLEAMVSGDGEDVWEACNFEALLELSVKYGDISSSEKAEQKQEMIEYFDSFCESFQSALDAEYGDGWIYTYSANVTSVSFSQGELEELQSEIDPNGIGIEISDAVTCQYELFIGNDVYDYGTITFVCVDSEWIMYE